MSAKFKFKIIWPSLGGVVFMVYFVFFYRGGLKFDSSKYSEVRYGVAYAKRHFVYSNRKRTEFYYKYKGEWNSTNEFGTYELNTKHIISFKVGDDLQGGAGFEKYLFPADSVPPEFLLTLPNTGWTTIPPKIK